MGNRKLGLILRCTGLALVVLGAFVLLPAVAQAQCTPGNHGVSIFKSCISPKNRCATDADCSDADFCNGIEQCATEENPGSNVLDCDVTLENPASHCDDLTLLDASDAVLNATGPGASSSTLLITSATGVVSGTCTAGTDLGGATTCTIAPTGVVHFRANYYTVVPTDPVTLNDQATVSIQDTCNNSPTGCSTTPNTVNFGAATTTVSGCSPGTPLICNDNNECTSDTCVPATGCVFPPVGDSTACADTDGNACTDAGCEAGSCVQGHVTTVCTPDTNECTSDPACDPATGLCNHPPVGDSTTCTETDGIACTTAGCEAGQCVQTHIADCNEEICRTPGFWGTHGGEEKASSVNITQAVLDNFAAAGVTLNICGGTISNTDVGSVNSALEAICVSPKGDSRLQLARQLTAAALNCGLTNSLDATPGTCTGAGESAGICSGVSIGDIWAACNDACPTGTTAIVDGHEIACIGAIDCFNNGGTVVFDGPEGFQCASSEDSCHDRDLVQGCFDFEPPGAAGSPRACNDARKNDVVVIP